MSRDADASESLFKTLDCRQTAAPISDLVQKTMNVLRRPALDLSRQHRSSSGLCRPLLGQGEVIRSEQYTLGRCCHRPERSAMDWRRAQLDQQLHVLVGAVALVLREAVAGVLAVEIHHHAVARDLGDDRCGGDAEALAIATDDFRLRQFEAWNQATVNQYVAGSEPQGFERAAARGHRRPKDVETIDLVHFGDADADRDCLLANRRKQLLALLVR